jgi:hypothetical protein
MYLTPVVTPVKVLAILKGTLEKDEFLLPHYRMDWEKAHRNGIGGISNGPSLVTFAAPPEDRLEFDGFPWDRAYILFLKKEKDGDVTFVTGQFDPEFSVFRLRRPTDNGQ